MGLIGKLFRNKDGAPTTTTPPLSAQFQESEPHSGAPSKTARRRELVQVVLRETVRQHGIPSDWIDCRVLSVVGSAASSGVHVTFIVRQGEDTLLTYVHAFEESFVRKMREFEPGALNWILSLSWQFSGDAPAGRNAMPDPGVWSQAGSAGDDAPDTTPAQQEDDELQQDLKALFAIRDAVLQQPGPAAADRVDFQPTQPAEAIGKKPGMPR
ncbi:MAG: hypothetical protein V4864_13805 [Pseudomonadota bacterium]